MRDFRRIDENDFLEDLERCDRNALYLAVDIDVEISVLNEALIDCYKSHAPLR